VILAPSSASHREGALLNHRQLSEHLSVLLGSVSRREDHCAVGGGAGGRQVPEPVSPRSRSRVEEWYTGTGADVGQTCRAFTWCGALIWCPWQELIQTLECSMRCSGAPGTPQRGWCTWPYTRSDSMFRGAQLRRRAVWRRRVPDTPFNSTSPISVKLTGVPSAASTTSWLTSTSPGLAYSAIRAAMFTVRPK
jgi:hypothetical protein